MLTRMPMPRRLLTATATASESACVPLELVNGAVVSAAPYRQKKGPNHYSQLGPRQHTLPFKVNWQL